MFTRLDHVGIVCHDLEATAAFYRSVFGFDAVHREVIESQGIREVLMRVNGTDDGHETCLQLIAPVREDSAVSAWLARHGEGVHHLAFGTADVRAAILGLPPGGPAALFDPPRTGSRGTAVTFLHPRDCHGVLTELVEMPRPPA
ncbi:methylmalonyl-CoA epimerase [Streptomyces sp. NBC_01477]|uniref:methylmalonyl-CoA epimerase n=1 Tax=Streptomyces sp. NBC_01477 TaxID=2976015 RepID=UPI002E314159|nr:methylmalonyl-CoA epimerase [Streptomyces sp. NBC_01477]